MIFNVYSVNVGFPDQTSVGNAWCSLTRSPFPTRLSSVRKAQEVLQSRHLVTLISLSPYRLFKQEGPFALKWSELWEDSRRGDLSSSC